MALSYNSTSFLIVSLLLICFILTSVKADLIDDVCSKTQHKDICLSALKGDPRSKGANLKGLMMISMDLSQKNAQSVRDLVEKLLDEATDPELKSRYSFCCTSYNDAIDNLKKLPDLFMSKDYNGINTHASAALSDPSKCDDKFSGPPAEVPQLKDANDKLRGLMESILVISKLLNG
ncbi:pectinesterase inhibitor-like [Lycium barbarum]|uniref:pectinesterase inhibitor-like n=1 Tax=Lycium barbarum TaxID=112863 RepID=UPI00293EA0C0|nr:pectinesterase inhibitor-like [Lycium barbarum]